MTEQAWLAAIPLLVAATVSACGSGGSSASSTGTPTTSDASSGTGTGTVSSGTTGTGGAGGGSGTGGTKTTGATGGMGGATSATGATSASSTASAAATGGTSGTGGAVCPPGGTAPCYDGPAGTEGVGTCKAGLETCNAQGTAWGPCVGEVKPAPEICDGLDNDCNGTKDDGLGSTTCGIGACQMTVQNCVGGVPQTCVPGQPTPQKCNGVDDNCNGVIDEGCLCLDGTMQSCYTGAPATQGVGTCKPGTQPCQGGMWGACQGETLPVAEVCNGKDDDCNGLVDDGLGTTVCGVGACQVTSTNCVGGVVQTCTPGLPSPEICDGVDNDCNGLVDDGLGNVTCGVGACFNAVPSCKSGKPNPCTPLPPQVEVCNGVDDNCNGMIDEGNPGGGLACSTGLLGVCAAGVTACVGGAIACNENVPSSAELCDGLDNNCNGTIDEGNPGGGGACNTGKPGVCAAGTTACQSGAIVCVENVQPSAEVCDGLDNNCNGMVDEGVCGTCSWSGAWGSPVDEEGFSVSADAAGNVIMGGYVNGTVDFGCGPLATGANWDATALVKWSPTGTCLWSKAAGSAQSHIVKTAVDPSGNIFVVGYFQGTLGLGGACSAMTSAGAADVFAAKLDANGACLWSGRYGNAANQNGIGVAVDSAGNAYITGYFQGQITFGATTYTSAGGQDIFLAKLSPTGAPVWAKTFGDAANQFGSGVVVDGSDNVIVTGPFHGTVDFGGGVLTSAGLGDVFVVKLTSTGAHVFSARYGDAADQDGYDAKVDAAGNIFLAGYNGGSMTFGAITINTGGGQDAYLAKLSPTGTPLWAKGFGSAGTQTAVAVAVDGAGNAAITGVLNGSTDFGGGVLTSAGSADIYVAKYDPSGAHVWSRRFGDAANQTPRSIGVDAAGNWLVTGFLQGPTDFGCGAVIGGGGEDIFVAKLTP